MKVLMTGMPFCTAEIVVRLHKARGRHEIRMLKCVGNPYPLEDGDITFEPAETARDIIERVSREWAPDMMVCWTPELYPPPREMENCPVKTAVIVSDWNIYYPQFEHNLCRYDLVLSDKAGSMYMRPYGVTPKYFGPIYSHRSGVHCRLDGLQRDIDIVFAGNMNAAAQSERCRLLEKVAPLSERYHVAFTGELPQDQYAILMNRARIVFNRSIRGEMNLRCFEAPACGALMFLEEDNLEVREWLQDRETVVYYDEDNLIDLLRHYLDNEDERARIADAGCRRIGELAGELRMDALLDAIWEAEPGERRFNELPPETQAFAELMQYASSMAPGQRAHVVSMLPRWRRMYPESVNILAASGCVGFESLNGTRAKQGRDVRRVRNWLLRASALAPDAAALWLNLAYFVKRAGSPELREFFLKKTLEANSCAYGGLIVGTFGDPYYTSWRRALAFGDARVKLLHAWAHAQLAAICLDDGRHAEAAAYAKESLRQAPEFPGPHQVMAAVESARGRPKRAAEILEACLPLTAFDAAHRTALVDACIKAGRIKDAMAHATQSCRLFMCRLMPDVAESFHKRALELSAAMTEGRRGPENE